MNPLHAWKTFWFRPISARPLGAFRIVFGLVVLTNLAVAAGDIDHWYSGVGLLQGTEAREIAGPLRPSILNEYQSPAVVHAWFALTALAAVGLTVGWHTRVMSVLFYATMLMIHNRNIVTNSGADVLVMVMSFYVMLSPCGVAYSLDARRQARRRGTVAEPLIVPWAQRLIQFQLCLIYFSTAVFKSKGSSWLNGTALHYVLNNTEVGRFRLDPLTQYPLAVNLLTHGALVIEFALAFFLWSRATRRWAALAGIALHAGIHLMVIIPVFGELMVACYLLFLDPDELDSLLRRVNPLGWVRRARAAEPSGERAVIPGRVDPAEPIPWRRPHEREPAGVGVGLPEAVSSVGRD